MFCFCYRNCSGSVVKLELVSGIKLNRRNSKNNLRQCSCISCSWSAGEFGGNTGHSEGEKMNSKAQGLPMNTIILIILVLFVLAGVGIFFFSQFQEGDKGFDQSQCVQLCQSIRASMASDETTTWTDIKNGPVAQSFCTGYCFNTIECKVRLNSEDAQNIWKTINPPGDFSSDPKC